MRFSCTKWEDTSTVTKQRGGFLVFPYMNANRLCVQHLAVHLANGQRVYFTKDSARKIASEPPQNTTLTAFFQLCQTDPFARKLLYVDVPIYYTWDKTRKIFQRRKQGMPEEGHPEIMKTNAIGRVFTVHPNNAECFYLRMLLHEIRGPTSFTDLRTIHGYLCQTYREACQQPLGINTTRSHTHSFS